MSALPWHRGRTVRGLVSETVVAHRSPSRTHDYLDRRIIPKPRRHCNLLGASLLAARFGIQLGARQLRQKGPCDAIGIKFRHLPWFSLRRSDGMWPRVKPVGLSGITTNRPGGATVSFAPAGARVLSHLFARVSPVATFRRSSGAKNQLAHLC